MNSCKPAPIVSAVYYLSVYPHLPTREKSREFSQNNMPGSFINFRRQFPILIPIWHN